MNLPVVKHVPTPTAADLWRRFSDLLFDHALAYGEEVPPDLNPSPTSWRAAAGDDAVSRRVGGEIVFSAEPGAMDHAAAALKAFEHIGSASPRRLHVPLCDGAWTHALEASGYLATTFALTRLQHAAAGTEGVPDGLLILPCRAARPAYEVACVRWAAVEPDAVLWPRHLDDPQYEAFAALRGGALVGVLGMQSRGQTVAIMNSFVDPAERRLGIGRSLLARLIDVAARAQAADVFAGLPVDTPAAAMFEAAGFRQLERYTVWTRADA